MNRPVLTLWVVFVMAFAATALYEGHQAYQGAVSSMTEVLSSVDGRN